ncbi:A/G-specific adenine glycosylase [Salimicrobium halophilum]|uniref:Adenine DNA glycosylase n=1 Tax=Salimicrobium halophilum TaxID=86666 RepID=A0A1G8WVP9_9BACI|nr:A/G-specific adenine glycosylase [Salimicrobium halophilum]SDJ81695.1 A/G-specific DNA-adenine glycosylase [Salimicrobium halophilum]
MKRNELADEIVKDFPAEDFRESLIRWFKQEQRTLPWRENQDPYRIWVSEIMLQQTKVETVIPYFEQFIRKFPTLEDLAAADEQDVLKAWEGLGYYSRARNLQTAVREVVSSYNAAVPDTVEEISSLKGVGPYTQGAILSIAYDQPVPAVDGNVMRVLSRILLVDEDIAKQSTRKLFELLVSRTISTDDPSSFNQGLMELGAIVCTPKSPSCLLCPVQEYCRAFHEGVEAELPVKSSKKTQKVLRYRTYIVENERGEVLVEKRPEEGLLANLWQYPMVKEEEVQEGSLYGLEMEEKGMVDRIKHTFSHLIWEMEVHRAFVLSGDVQKERAEFVSKELLTDYPFPVSHQKIHPYVG